MRLKPAVSVDEAVNWLATQASAAWGVEVTPELIKTLTPMAEAMAAISAADVPSDVEPMFL
jgi:hypothetical protein